MCSTTIIIVGFDGKIWLPPLVQSLRPCITANAGVLIVDNGGNEGVIAEGAHRVEVSVVETPERMGFCDANNYGLSAVQIPTDLVCFLNQDVVVDPRWLTPILNMFDSYDDIGALSPVHMTYDFKRLNPNFRSSIRHDRRCMSRRANSDGWFEQDNLIAAAMVVRKSVLAKVGGFDPIFGSYCEDYDLCRRIREAGYKTGVVPSSRIGHFDGSATRTKQAELKRERQVVRNWAIHRIRSSKKRLRATMREVCWGMLKRLLKSLLRRPGSQHPGSVLRAWASLISLIPRLISKKLDDRITQSHFLVMTANLASAIKTDEKSGES